MPGCLGSTCQPDSLGVDTPGFRDKHDSLSMDVQEIVTFFDVLKCVDVEDVRPLHTLQQGSQRSCALNHALTEPGLMRDDIAVHASHEGVHLLKVSNPVCTDIMTLCVIRVPPALRINTLPSRK